MPASRSDVTLESVLARRNKTQRLHHAQLVGHAPVLDHHSVLKPDDVHHIGEGIPPCRRVAVERPEVGAAAALADPGLSPTEITSSIVILKSGNAPRRYLMVPFTPSGPPPMPRWCSSASGATSSSTTARLPWLKPSSIRRR